MKIIKVIKQIINTISGYKCDPKIAVIKNSIPIECLFFNTFMRLCFEYAKKLDLH